MKKINSMRRSVNSSYKYLSCLKKSALSGGDWVKTLIILLLISSVAKGQVDSQPPDTIAVDSLRSSNLVLLARADTDSIVLRWGPDTPGGWVTANQTGYILERAEYDSTQIFDPNSFQQLTSRPIKPWSLQEWEEQYKQSENDYVALAAQTLHGESFVVDIPDQPGGQLQALRNASEELMNRHGFALLAADTDPVAAQGLALRYVDKDVEDEQIYVYRIRAAGNTPDYYIKPAYQVVRAEPHEPSPPPQNLEAENLDGKIVLKWDELPNHQYSGYFIHRSSDGGASWKQLNEFPHMDIDTDNADEEAELNVAYMDTTVVNYRTYRYKVVGITPFAELSTPAEVIGKGRDLTPPPAPKIFKPEQLGKSTFRIHWDYPDTVAGIKGFLVAKSAESQRGFEPIFSEPLPPDSREFVDKEASMDEPFYVVGAIDTAGNMSPSMSAYGELIDEEPPSKPTGLTGSIDTAGVVRLHWKLGPEDDVMGYRVLWANDDTHEFSAASSLVIRDTTFTDTVAVETLTKHVYYKIAALDQRYNRSNFSDILKLKRPDVVPPGPSVFTNVFVTDSSVTLKWNPSTSKDLNRQVLYRKQQVSETEWDSLAGLSRTAGSYLDTAVVQNTRYRYRIQAVDSAGLRSDFASTVQARPYDSGVRPAPELVYANYDTTRQQVILEWEYQPPKQEPYYFVLYRSLEGNTPMTYKAIKAEELRYEDRAVVKGEVYQYGIKVKSRNGAESKLSEIRRVSIQR